MKIVKKLQNLDELNEEFSKENIFFSLEKYISKNREKVAFVNIEKFNKETLKTLENTIFLEKNVYFFYNNWTNNLENFFKNSDFIFENNTNSFYNNKITNLINQIIELINSDQLSNLLLLVEEQKDFILEEVALFLAEKIEKDRLAFYKIIKNNNWNNIFISFYYLYKIKDKQKNYE